MGRSKRRNDHGFWPASRLYTTAITMARRAGLGPDDVVVAGVSGGPDSCALMRVLSIARRRFGFRVQTAHLMHDFRGQETCDDANFARRMWPKCIIDEVDVAAYQREAGVSSFEQAARDVRYDFLARVARQAGARLVAVGHTADDLAETVLLHLARGSGAHGLRGMRELDEWPYPAGREQGLRVWRPLLELTRHHTVSYCRNYGIDYRDDSTNYMREFARNRVRHDLMPALKEQLNPRIVEALGRLSRTASAQADYMEQQADLLWPDVAPEQNPGQGVLYLNRERLAKAHPALQYILLRRAWIAVTGQEKRLTERHLAAMSRIVAAPGSGKTVELPRGYRFFAKGARAMLSALQMGEACPYPPLSRPFRLTLPLGPIAVAVTKQDGWEVTTQAVRLPADASLDTGDPMAAYLSPAALAEGATVRAWQPGDRIQPLGMSGTRKLQDLFTDAGVPQSWRERAPLVVTPRGIAWVAGVRIAHWAAAPHSDGGDLPAIMVRFERSATGVQAARTDTRNDNGLFFP